MFGEFLLPPPPTLTKGGAKGNGVADHGEGDAPPMLAKGGVKGYGETNNKGSETHNWWNNSKGPTIIKNCWGNSKGGATQNIPLSLLPDDDAWKMFHGGSMTNHAEDLALAFKHGFHTAKGKGFIMQKGDATYQAKGDDFIKGWGKGHVEGRAQGRAEGRAEAYDEGHDKGYSEGFEDGLDVGVRSCRLSIEKGCTTVTVDGEDDAD